MLLLARHAPIAADLHTLMRRQNSDAPEGSGSGRSLPTSLLIVSTLAALFATLFSFYLIWKQLKNYRKPILQRYVVRLLVMVPIYSIASVISLYSLNLADIIDLVRDLYEAFVIYCFFNLLIEYLGGERSTIILLHGRAPQSHIFPFNLILHPMDASDPYTFLALKRGVLQYVQIKPILAILTVLLKSIGKYEGGKISPSNGYTWISFTYNLSVFLSLYCLGMFWKCLNADLTPFRATSKFLCVKGIIFFSFWQGLGISILVAAGLIRKIGPVADSEYISLAVQDSMICLEMPLFALGHAYAFSHKDYVDPFAHYAARLPVYYALRDCIGLYDVFSDSLTTVRGTGYGYQTFEPSEGVVHQSLARERRSKAGLRYTQGGKAKYWLPQRGTGDACDAAKGARHQGPLSAVRKYLDKRRMERQGFAPLDPNEAAEIIHDNPDAPPHSPGDDESSALLRHSCDMAKSALNRAEEGLHFFSERSPDGDDTVESLSFGSPSEDEEDLYQRSRNLDYGDYTYPNVDVAREASRKSRWKNDDDIVHRRRKGRASDDVRGGAKGKNREGDGGGDGGGGGESAKRKKATDEGQGEGVGSEESGVRGKKKAKSPWLAWEAENGDGVGASDSTATENDRGDDVATPSSSSKARTDGKAKASSSSSPSPPSGDAQANGDDDASSRAKQHDPYGALDLVVEDFKAEERERLLERRRGDPALRADRSARVFRKQYEDQHTSSSPSSSDTPGGRYAKVEKRMVDAALERLDRVQEGHANPKDAGKKEGEDDAMIEQSSSASVDPGIEQDTPIARTVEPKARTAFRKGALPGSMMSIVKRGDDDQDEQEQEQEQEPTSSTATDERNAQEGYNPWT